MEQVAQQFLDLIHKYESTDHEVLVSLARESMSNLVSSPAMIDLFKQMGKNTEDIASVIVALFAASANADGKYSDTEMKFISEIAGANADFIGELPAEHSAELVDAIVDVLTDVEKGDAINLAATIAACDGNVNLAESKFLIRLLV